LRPHRIKVIVTPSIDSKANSSGGGDLVQLVIRFELSQNQLMLARPCIDLMNDVLGVTTKSTPNPFSINRDDIPS
jgi:hypothetical protein